MSDSRPNRSVCWWSFVGSLEEALPLLRCISFFGRGGRRRTGTVFLLMNKRGGKPYEAGPP